MTKLAKKFKQILGKKYVKLDEQQSLLETNDEKNLNLNSTESNVKRTKSASSQEQSTNSTNPSSLTLEEELTIFYENLRLVGLW